MKINIKEKKQDKWLFWTVIFLVGFGLAVLFSASSGQSLKLTNGDSAFYYFFRQFLKVVPAAPLLSLSLPFGAEAISSYIIRLDALIFES